MKETFCVSYTGEWDDKKPNAIKDVSRSFYPCALSHTPGSLHHRFHFQNHFVLGVLRVYYSTYKMNDVCFERNVTHSLSASLNLCATLIPNSEHFFFHAFRIPIHESLNAHEMRIDTRMV